MTEPDAIWALPLQHAIYEEVEYPPYDHGYTEVTVNIVEHTYKGDNTNVPVPDDMREAVWEVHQDGDYGHGKTYRQLDSNWYVLVDYYFYEYKNGELISIGTMPITRSVSISEASGGNGAQDFVRLNDVWYAADTEASRVIKLNEQLEVIAEVAVPNPYGLTISGDQLHIASTAQVWTVTLDLEVVDIATQTFASTANLAIVPYKYFYPNQYYVDPLSGLMWYYIEGMLYQYDADKQQYRKFFIGHHENFYAQVQIYPYKDDVIVMLDRRLERFDRSGKWLSTLTYPRSKPDGIYDWTPRGENSLVFDQEAGLIYMVQGFRIIVIDLRSGEVSTIFRQNYADIGKLVEHEGDLYFLLHSHHQLTPRMGYDASTFLYSELVKIGIDDWRIQRYVTEGYYDAWELLRGAESGAGDGAGINEPKFVLRRYR